MDDGYSPWSFLLLAAILVIETIFYGFEAAIHELSVIELQKRKEEGDKRAAGVLKALGRSFTYSSVVLIASTLNGLLGGAMLLRQGQYFLLHSLFGDGHKAGWQSILLMAISAFLLILVLVMGKVSAKRIARRYPEAWAYRLLPVVRILSLPYYPAATLAGLGSRLIAGIFKAGPGTDVENVTEEDIMTMVNEGHEQGVIEASEAEMITNIFEFDDKDAGDIMTHRTSITAFSEEMTLDEVLEAMLTGSNSRYPVYRESLDDIVGIIHLKDVVLFQKKEEFGKKKLKELKGLMRKAHFIPETRNIRKLFEVMRSRKIHMVIVIDEYGQVEGLITMEDILEEIVGNILDEYDEEEEFVKIQGDGWLMKGVTPLSEAGEFLELDFEEEDCDTLNGFLISKLDRIPSEEERPEVVYKGYRFRVLYVENKMIGSVRVEKLPEEEEHE
ncbi:MAG: HlyC/CorC family transporter [Lachnospiraceae bacterium]|nr:HlyC/CorC family transporter [Lachnospiraceae bacterium]